MVDEGFTAGIGTGEVWSILVLLLVLVMLWCGWWYYISMLVLA